MKPVNRCIFVLPDEPMRMQGGIVMPATSNAQVTGRVLASDTELCKKGDRVIYARVFPIELPNHETQRPDKVNVVQERDIIGVDPQGTLDMSFEEAEKEIAGSIVKA